MPGVLRSAVLVLVILIVLVLVQVVVLIETGRRRAEMLDSASREQLLGRLLDAAVDLRRRLA